MRAVAVALFLLVLARPPAQEGEGFRGAWPATALPACEPTSDPHGLPWPPQGFWDRLSAGIRPIRDEPSPEQRRLVARLLDGKLVGTDFCETPLREAVAQLSRAARVPISLDPTVPRRVAAAPVTLKAHSVNLRDALDLVLMIVEPEGSIVIELRDDSIRVRPR